MYRNKNKISSQNEIILCDKTSYSPFRTFQEPKVTAKIRWWTCHSQVSEDLAFLYSFSIIYAITPFPFLSFVSLKSCHSPNFIDSSSFKYCPCFFPFLFGLVLSFCLCLFPTSSHTGFLASQNSFLKLNAFCGSPLLEVGLSCWHVFMVAGMGLSLSSLPFPTDILLFDAPGSAAFVCLCQVWLLRNFDQIKDEGLNIWEESTMWERVAWLNFEFVYPVFLIFTAVGPGIISFLINRKIKLLRPDEKEPCKQWWLWGLLLDNHESR